MKLALSKGERVVLLLFSENIRAKDVNLAAKVYYLLLLGSQVLLILFNRLSRLRRLLIHELLLGINSLLRSLLSDRDMSCVNRSLIDNLHLLSQRLLLQ